MLPNLTDISLHARRSWLPLRNEPQHWQEAVEEQKWIHTVSLHY